jgi:hypothetical protein
MKGIVGFQSHRHPNDDIECDIASLLESRKGRDGYPGCEREAVLREPARESQGCGAFPTSR